MLEIETLRSTYSRSERHSRHFLIESAQCLKLAESPDSAFILDAFAEELAQYLDLLPTEEGWWECADDQREVIDSLRADGGILLIDIIAQGLHDVN